MYVSVQSWGICLCVCGTCMKMLKRGSRFCLVLIWSRAHDWWLQNLAVSFWNHSPSVPPNWNTRAHTNITIKDCVVASWKKNIIIMKWVKLEKCRKGQNPCCIFTVILCKMNLLAHTDFVQYAQREKRNIVWWNEVKDCDDSLCWALWCWWI